MSDFGQSDPARKQAGGPESSGPLLTKATKLIQIGCECDPECLLGICMDSGVFRMWSGMFTGYMYGQRRLSNVVRNVYWVYVWTAASFECGPECLLGICMDSGVFALTFSVYTLTAIAVTMLPAALQQYFYGDNDVLGLSLVLCNAAASRRSGPTLIEPMNQRAA